MPLDALLPPTAQYCPLPPTVLYSLYSKHPTVVGGLSTLHVCAVVRPLLLMSQNSIHHRHYLWCMRGTLPPQTGGTPLPARAPQTSPVMSFAKSEAAGTPLRLAGSPGACFVMKLFLAGGSTPCIKFKSRLIMTTPVTDANFLRNGQEKHN